MQELASCEVLGWMAVSSAYTPNALSACSTLERRSRRSSSGMTCSCSTPDTPSAVLHRS